MELKSSEIETLLKCDEENAKMIRRLFADHDAELSEALEDAAQLFVTFSRVFSQQAKDDLEQETLHAIQEQLGFSDAEEFYSAIISSDPNSPESDLMLKAKDAVDRFYSRRARGWLLLLIQRCYMFAATDLLRLRGNVALGHLRLAVEAAYFMNIMRDDPSVAHVWVHLESDEEGKQFFKEHKKGLGSFMDQYELAGLYNLTSGTAQHARFASLVFGLRFDSGVKGNRRQDEYKLVFQEGETRQQLLWAVFLLEMQYRLFMAMREGLPEIDDPLLVNTRLPNFRNKVNRLWKHLEKVFPEQAAQLRKGQS
jgi:hypothetical protein